jgi:hypothetical protein
MAPGGAVFVGVTIWALAGVFVTVGGLASEPDVGVAVAAEVGVGVGVGVPVGVAVGVAVGVCVRVAVGVLVGRLVGVAVLVGVHVGVNVGVSREGRVGVFVGGFWNEPVVLVGVGAVDCASTDSLFLNASPNAVSVRPMTAATRKARTILPFPVPNLALET